MPAAASGPYVPRTGRVKKVEARAGTRHLPYLSGRVEKVEATCRYTTFTLYTTSRAVQGCCGL